MAIPVPPAAIVPAAVTAMAARLIQPRCRLGVLVKEFLLLG
jgi:hypothetical protein